MLNPMNMDGRVIMITGAAQGIGRGVAQKATELGATLVLVDLNEEGIKETAEMVNAAGVYVGSVADPGFVQETVDDVVQKHGVINGLFNNAGIIRTAMIHKMSVADWQAVIDVNLTGVFHCLQAVGRHMIERVKEGDDSPCRIVNVSSIAGRKGTIGQINYGAAKSGVLGITMSAAREWARHGICINSVCFGAVETPMTEVIRSPKFIERTMASIPMGRIAQPEEVAGPCCFLLSDTASYITGQHLSIDGGSHIGF
ncbi:MAG: 3-oxoacyl-ACP reductase [Gammaproteobacteria bacterium]|nr:3-oxoacyl-ACP reductase [Gammaproteobacteria bacterium]|tara:strand:+ start:3591 stop:4358 length:768 start_codon:yes stop_codon:yes gene_type:complete